MNQWFGALGAVAVIVGIVYLLRRSAFDSGEPPEDELHRLCRGDKEMMERLISHEQDKRNGRTREAAIRTAVDSIKRDNR